MSGKTNVSVCRGHELANSLYFENKGDSPHHGSLHMYKQFTISATFSIIGLNVFHKRRCAFDLNPCRPPNWNKGLVDTITNFYLTFRSTSLVNDSEKNSDDPLSPFQPFDSSIYALVTTCRVVMLNSTLFTSSQFPILVTVPVF